MNHLFTSYYKFYLQVFIAILKEIISEEKK